jgi:type III pantothenate kinase
MNLVIDAGNTRAKAATFQGKELHEKFAFDSVDYLKKFLSEKTFDNVLISSVGISANEIAESANVKEMSITLSHLLPLPITIKYATPHTLGVDRIAAVCGALDLFPNRDCLVIDAGTCVTYELLDKNGNYHGGAISPGLEMRLKAMHTFTARLPLVNLQIDADLVGDSTEHGLQSGAWYGVVAEMEGVIDRYKIKYPEIQVLVCGGNATLFENRLKHTIFAAPDLVLGGLNRILLHNAV